jgi:hypothetical protein
MKFGIKNLLVALSVATLSVASIGYAQVNTTPNDSWDSDGTFNSPSPTLSQSTTGATLNTHSLAATNLAANFWGPATFNLTADPTIRTALANATQLSYTINMNAVDLNGGSGSFNGFAQDNEIAITLFAPTGGPSGGLNFFMQDAWGVAGVSDSSGQSATWSGVDGNRTLVWDLTKFTATDPNTRSTKTLGQFLATYPDITDSKIGFAEQTGGGTSTVGDPTMFWDNVKLLDAQGNTLAVIGDFEAVPEPGSLLLLGLAVPGLLVARRYRKSVR